MKRSKLLTRVLVVMLLISLSGVSAFADVVAPVVEEPAVVEETAPAEEPVLLDEPVAEPEVSYLRFDVGSDLVFVAEDGVIVSVTTELEMNPEEPAALVEEPVAPVEEPAALVEEPVAPVEEPAAPVEEPAAPVEEPAAPVEEPAEPAEEPAEPAEEPAEPAEEPAEPVEEPVAPADPYAEYIGLSVTEGIDLLLASGDFEGPIELDIFANSEMAESLMTMLEEGYAELLKLQAVALDSDNPNAERFLNAAIYRITPGKMNLLDKLGAFLEDEEMDYASWSVLSVKEIQSMTKSNRTTVQSAVKKKVKSNNGKAKTK